MKNLFSIAAIAAVMLDGAGAAAAELPTFEVMGFPSSRRTRFRSWQRHMFKSGRRFPRSRRAPPASSGSNLNIEHMSAALPPKADIAQRGWDGVPKGERYSYRPRFQRVRPRRSDSSKREFFAACLTNLRKCRTTTEESPRRDARSRGAFGWMEPPRAR